MTDKPPCVETGVASCEHAEHKRAAITVACAITMLCAVAALLVRASADGPPVRDARDPPTTSEQQTEESRTSPIGTEPFDGEPAKTRPRLRLILEDERQARVPDVRLTVHRITRHLESGGFEVGGPVAHLVSDPAGIAETDLDPGDYCYVNAGSHHVLYNPPEEPYAKEVTLPDGRQAVSFGRTPFRCSGPIRIGDGPTELVVSVVEFTGIVGALPAGWQKGMRCELSLKRKTSVGGFQVDRINVDTAGQFRIGGIASGSYYVNGWYCSDGVLGLVHVDVPDYVFGTIHDVGELVPYSADAMDVVVRFELDGRPISAEDLSSRIGPHLMGRFYANRSPIHTVDEAQVSPRIVVADYIPGFPTLRSLFLPLLGEKTTVVGLALPNPYEDMWETLGITRGSRIGLAAKAYHQALAGRVDNIRYTWSIRSETPQRLELLCALQP